MGGDFMLVITNMATPGAHVKKGDVVAEFDRQYQLTRIDNYKASVIQAEADIKRMKANLYVSKDAHNQLIRVAKADVEKARLDLKTAEVRSAIEAETLKLGVEEAEAHYKQLTGEVKLFDASQRAQLRITEIDRDRSKIELQRATANVERMVLRAPMNGIVVMQSTRRGGEFGQVQIGDQIYPGQFFMQIVDPRSMVVNATINQVDSEMLRLGMKARTELDAYPDLALPTHVAAIGAVPRSGGRRPSFVKDIPIRLKLDQQDPKVIPDLSAGTNIVLAAEKQATLAPLGSIFQDNDQSRPYVFIRSPDGWERREVEVGLKDNVYAAIRSGLQAGDEIAAERPGLTQQPKTQ